MKKYLINISGGGIKFIGLFSAFINLLNFLLKKKTTVDNIVVSGTSAGGITAFLYYAEKLEEGLEIAKQTDNINIIFSKFKSPVGKIGGFSLYSILALPFRKKYLGEMDNLEKNIRKLISKEEWDKVLKKDVYIHCIDEETEEKISFNLKYLNYEQGIGVMIGSATISPIIKARKVKIGGTTYSLVDGGHRDSSPGSYLMESGIVTNFDECVTIWSRNNPVEYARKGRRALKNFFERLIFTYSAYGRETSLNDEKLEKEYCQKNNKKHASIYMNIETEGTYSITKKQIEDAQIKAKKEILNYISNA